jgi:hypothetical protein
MFISIHGSEGSSGLSSTALDILLSSVMRADAEIAAQILYNWIIYSEVNYLASLPELCK